MLKQKIYRLVEKGSHGARYNMVFDYFIMALILLNLFAIIAESFSGLSAGFVRFLKLFEIVSVIVFTIEYLLRLYVSSLTHPANNKLNSALKFIFSGYGLIDLFAILPFYLPFIIKADLRILRVLRLARFVRIFKLTRYNKSINLILDVVREKRAELGITIFIAFLTIVVASVMMYYVEGDVQPDDFPNILASFWWAIATLTTVGYGDVVPITVAGKFISGIIAVLGIGLVALPTGMISAGFMERIKSDASNDEENKNNQDSHSVKCPHSGGEVDN